MGWMGLIANTAGYVLNGIQSRDAAQNAAQAQEQYAGQALAEEQANQQAAGNFQTGEWGQQQGNLAPYLGGGATGMGELTSLLSTPGQGLLTPWTQQFQAPTLQQAEQYPGYQFQLQQGEGALQNSAAASGQLESANTQEALNNYAQNFAQNDYTNVYNQALQQYLNSYNIFNQNQANQYSRLSGLAGMGEQATNQFGSEGQMAANNMSYLDLMAGQQQAQQENNIGSAMAAGDIGSSNAWSNMIGGLQSELNPMGSMMGGGGGGGGGGMGWTSMFGF